MIDPKMPMTDPDEGRPEDARGNLVRQLEPGEAMLIGPDIEVCLVSIKGKRAKLAIKAPKSVKINRREP